jgi:hypothetical protein
MKTKKIDAPHRIRVMVAYEDYDAGKRAQQACQKIIESVHLDQELSPDLWKFDMLKLRTMCEAAADEVAGADLLVVAPCSELSLPAGVQEWIRSSLQHPCRPKALLFLVGPDSEDFETSNQAAYQLKELAEQLSLPCWCLPLDTSNGAWSEPVYLPQDLQRVAQAVFVPSMPSSPRAALKVNQS